VKVRAVQTAVWANKLAKGFNVTDIAQEIHFLRREVDELEEAWRLGKPDVDLEVADVVAFAVSVAEMLGVDAQDALAQKLAINAGRTYIRRPGGQLVRVHDGEQ
jgi:NTP pyrophosphatase (non-canonical NTP hydrolase)